MKRTLENVVLWLMYATFFVPLLVLPYSFIFPFIVPKVVALRIAMTFMMGGYGLLMLSNWREYRPRLTWVTGALLIFLLSFFVSTVVGVDPYHSFWDNHERMLGFFTIVHYVGYYLVATALIKDWAGWRTAARMFLFAGSIVMLIGLYQVADPDFLLNGGSDRVASTLGNSIYVGGYGLFLAFLSLLLYIRETVQVWRWFSIGTGILALLGLVFSGTRGSVLGLAVGVVVGCILYIVSLKEHRRVRIGLGITLAAGCLLVGVLYANRTSSFVRDVPALNRVFSSSITDIANSSRVIAWKVAISSWKERPIFGWGPNNFFYAFNEYYNPRSLEFGYGETWFDNAHNIILNTLSVQGLFGLLSYLAIFAGGIVMLTVAYRRGRLNVHIFVIGTAFLVAHLVGNVTVFENPTSYLYFMFWLAMVNRLSLPTDKNTEGATSDRPISGMAVGVMAAVTIIINLIFNYGPAAANHQTFTAFGSIARDLPNAEPVLKQVLSLNSPHIDDIRNDIGRQVIEMVSNYHDKLGAEKSLALLAIVREALVENTYLHPEDIRMYLMLSQLETVAYSVTQDNKYLVAADAQSEKALALSPHRQQVIFGLSNLELQLGKNDLAIKHLEQALADNAKIPEAYWRLMVAYKVAENDAKVVEVYDLAKKNQIVFSQSDQDIINRVLEATKLTTKKPAK